MKNIVTADGQGIAQAMYEAACLIDPVGAVFMDREYKHPVAKKLMDTLNEAGFNGKPPPIKTILNGVEEDYDDGLNNVRDMTEAQADELIKRLHKVEGWA